MRRDGKAFKKGAILRGDGDMYRYVLWRIWDDTQPAMLWVMFNPSTADHMQDDPTIRRCMHFAKRERHGGIRVVNLFAFRSKEPTQLREVEDPVGPRNDDFIMRNAAETYNQGGMVVAGWGALTYQNRATHETARVATVLQKFADYSIPVFCLGVTAAGHPRHPLYVIGDTPFHRFQFPAHEARRGRG